MEDNINEKIDEPTELTMLEVDTAKYEEDLIKFEADSAKYDEDLARYDRANTMPGLLEFIKQFSSPASAFIILWIGIFVQSMHTYFIGEHLSSIEGTMRIVQAAALALFLTGALVYFSIRASNGSKSAEQLAWVFFFLEAFMNLYYWSDKYVIEPLLAGQTTLWTKMLVAVPLAVAIPWTLKSYAYEIVLFTRKPTKPVEPTKPVARQNMQMYEVDSLDDVKTALASKISSEMSKIADQQEEDFTNLNKKIEENNEMYVKKGDDIKLKIVTREGDNKKVSTIEAKIGM